MDARRAHRHVDLALDRDAASPLEVEAHASTGSGMDERTFDGFYLSSYRRLVGHIYAMCGNLEQAQDCVQEAFIRAWDKRDP